MDVTRKGGFLWYVLVSVAVIVLLGVIIYSNTLDSPFIFDDIGAMVNNPDRQDLDLSFFNWLGRRAVPYITFDVNYYFNEERVFGYHAVNIGIHIINALIVYFLIYLLSKKATKTTKYYIGDLVFTNHQALAMLGGALFVAHPIQSQAVTYIVQRIASLATLFYLLGMLGYVKYRLGKGIRKYIWAGVSLLSVFAAMSSKEIAITAPIAIAGMELFFFSESFRGWLKRAPKLIPWLLLILVIPAYMVGVPRMIQDQTASYRQLQIIRGGLGMRSEYEDATFRQAVGVLSLDSAEAKDITRGQYLLTQFNVIRTYVRLVLLPVRQNLDYDYPLSKSLWEWKTVGSLFGHLALLGVGVWLFIKKRRLVSYGIFFFFLALSVESSIFPISDVIFEHRLYLPFTGFTLVAAGAVQWLLEKKGKKYHKFIWGGLVILILVLGTATSLRNRVWQDKLRLWQDVAAKSPGKGRAHNNLGMYYFDGGDVAAAIKEFEVAIAGDKGYAEPRNNLGMIYVKQGRLDEAIVLLKEAIEAKNNYSHAYNNLGAAYIKKKRQEDAEIMFRKAVDIDSKYVAAQDNLGMLLVETNRLGEAEEIFNKAIELAPDRAATLNNLGVVYFRQGRIREATEMFKQALEKDPNHPGARGNLRKLNENYQAGLEALY